MNLSATKVYFCEAKTQRRMTPNDTRGKLGMVVQIAARRCVMVVHRIRARSATYITSQWQMCCAGSDR